MSLYEIILIAIGLAMDAFAVSIGAATTGFLNGPRSIFRISFHFGLFQFLMPIVGWFLGVQVLFLIVAIDHWIAFTLLGFVGVRMIRSGSTPHSNAYRKDPSKGFMLIMLSIATSIDAFAVGLSLAMLNVKIWYPSVMTGIITAGLSLLGIGFGSKLSNRFGKKMEIVGGFFLIGIGIKILIDHLF